MSVASCTVDNLINPKVEVMIAISFQVLGRGLLNEFFALLGMH